MTKRPPRPRWALDMIFGSRRFPKPLITLNIYRHGHGRLQRSRHSNSRWYFLWCLHVLLLQWLYIFSIRSKAVTLKHISKSMTTHMLTGNYATDEVSSLNNETQAIDPSVFLPQRKPALVRYFATCQSLRWIDPRYSLHISLITPMTYFPPRSHSRMSIETISAQRLIF
jgi:hypothetical protein